MSYKPPDKNILAIHVLKFGDSGPELVASWSKKGFFKDQVEERRFAVRQGVVLMTIQQFSMGLSGPFPVSADSSDFSNIKCLVYAFELEDHSLKDTRFGNIASTILVFYFPLSLEQAVLSKKSQLEHALLKLTAGKQSITEINEEFLTLVEVQIHEVLYQMELVILGANIKLLLSLRKTMKWIIYADENSNHQEVTRKLLFILFDKVESYRRTISKGLITSSTIKTFSDSLTIETRVLGKSIGLETTGEDRIALGSDHDIVFFVIPSSYSLEDESLSFLEILGNCDEKNPVVVFIEQLEEAVSSMGPGWKSLTELKKQLLKTTKSPLLVLTGIIDQKKLIEAMKWAIDQYARKIGVPIVQFDHLTRKQKPL
ncbi:MAG: hypothetical protein ACFFD4_01425 [Candidatus Odinarchaeota archaeon]